MIKTTPLRFLCGFILLMLLAANAYAQRPTLAEVRVEREQLKRLIETAHEVLTAYPDERAQQFLSKAETLAKESDQKIAAGQLLLAQAQIREAKTIVEKAVKLALESPLLRLHNRLQELLQRAETEVLGSGNREAIRLVQEARKNKLLGEQAVQKLQPLQAAQHFQVGITLLERALKLVGGNTGGEGNPAELLQRARDYFLELSRQLEERLRQCENPAARRLLDQIQKQTQLAEEAERKGDFTLALRFRNNAIRLLLRALDLCGTALTTQDAGALTTEVSIVREALANAEEQVVANEEPRARALLDWARRLLLEAEADVAAQKTIAAQRRLQRARTLIEKAARHKALPILDHHAQCLAALEQLAEDMAEMQEQLASTPNSEAQSLLELARKASSEAEKICQRKTHTLQSFAAFRTLLRLAHQFLLQTETLLQDSAPAMQEQEVLRQRLQQLDATLNEMQTNAGTTPQSLANVLVEQAVHMRDRSRAAFQSKQFYVSAELCNLAFDLLREALKLGKAE